MREVSLTLVLSRIREGWRTPALLSCVALLFTFVGLGFSRPIYHVEMAVIPAPAVTTQTPSGIGGALGSLFALSNGSQGGTDYVRYQRLVTSPVVAQRMQDHRRILQRVFSAEWDDEHQRWVEPYSLKRSLFGWLYGFSHVPAWTPPDATALSNYLQNKFVLIPSPTSDLVLVSMDGPDPEFSKLLLLTAHTEANNLLRDQVAQRAQQQVRYLEGKIQQTTVADYRAALLTLLSSQEKTLMMTQTGASFAAEIVNPPMSSSTPVSPRPLLSLGVAILVGIIAGCAIVIFLGPEWWRAPYRRLSRLGRGSPSTAQV